jgi:hypothetical protein
MADLLISVTGSQRRASEGMILHLAIYDQNKPVGSRERSMFAEDVTIPEYPLPIEMPEAVSYTEGCLRMLASALDARAIEIALVEAEKGPSKPYLM